MRVYSDQNPAPFVSSPVRDILPVWDHAQGERDATFGGLRLHLEDGRTVVFLDPGEMQAIERLGYLSRP